MPRSCSFAHHTGLTTLPLKQCRHSIIADIPFLSSPIPPCIKNDASKMQKYDNAVVFEEVWPRLHFPIVLSLSGVSVINYTCCLRLSHSGRSDLIQEILQGNEKFTSLRQRYFKVLGHFPVQIVRASIHSAAR